MINNKIAQVSDTNGEKEIGKNQCSPFVGPA